MVATVQNGKTTKEQIRIHLRRSFNDKVARRLGHMFQSIEAGTRDIAMEIGRDDLGRIVHGVISLRTVNLTKHRLKMIFFGIIIESDKEEPEGTNVVASDEEEKDRNRDWRHYIKALEYIADVLQKHTAIFTETDKITTQKFPFVKDRFIKYMERTAYMEEDKSWATKEGNDNGVGHFTEFGNVSVNNEWMIRGAEKFIWTALCGVGVSLGVLSELPPECGVET